MRAKQKLDAFYQQARPFLPPCSFLWLPSGLLSAVCINLILGLAAPTWL
jgi:hypothetical protein